MHRQYYFLLCLLLLTGNTFAQGDQYWQQKIDYQISVSLDDSLHVLEGKETIVYHNFSPHTLNELHIHFWANAYSDKSSPLFKQLAEDGELAARFCSDEEMGSMTGMKFTSNGQELKLEFEDEFKEIGKLTLNEPIKPGDSIMIHTPFKMKIPGDLSRGGHVGNSYNITQWFPKVAMYDKNGWHTMPYLNWGEYYDEFGDYDVSITLPKNYVVGATGNLQTEEEIASLNRRVERSKRAIEKSDFSDVSKPRNKETKTIRYTEKNVHDFAWFASPDFLVQHETIQLDSSDQEIEAWAFFPASVAPSWKFATNFLKSSTKHYSEEVGTYAYKTVKAVFGALRAGGGMEYPTITVIGPGTESVLHTVILHEVGHNWFQGMLGTNERQFPYMDEAINSFYENMYFNEKDPSGANKRAGDIQDALSEYVIKNNAYRHENQANNLHSCQYTKLNYGMVVYTKAAQAFNYLEDYLGKELFSKCMKKFFNDWHHKHPQPEDLKNSFEQVSKQNLSWFFNDLMSSDEQLDYAIASVTDDKISLQNKGGIVAPVKLTIRNQGVIVFEEWLDGFADTFSKDISQLSFDEIKLNDDVFPYEVNLRNNFYNYGRIGQSRRVGLGIGLNTNYRKSFNFMPIIGGNTSDGFMLGLACFSGFIPQTKLETQLAPMYATNSGNLVGTGRIRYNKFWKNKFHNSLRIGISGSQFSQDIGILQDNGSIEYLPFTNLRVEPFISLKLKKLPLRNSISNTFRASYIYREMPHGFGRMVTDASYSKFGTIQLSHIYEDRYPIFSHRAETQLQIGDQFSRVNFTWNATLPYNEKKDVRLRVFAGYQFSPSTDPQISALFDYGLSGNYGLYDPMMSGYLLGRSSATTGLWSRQILQTGGGFATMNRAFTSNSFILAANLNGPLPIITPKWMRLFTNFAIMPHQSFVGTEMKTSNILLVEAGLNLVVYKDVLEIYIPLIYSSELMDYLELNKRIPFASDNPFNFTKNITFQFNLHKLNPFNAVDAAALVGG